MMRKLFLWIWLFIGLLAKAISLTFKIVVGAVFFLGAAAEIASLLLSNGSILMENIRNLAAIVAHSDIPPSDPAAKPAAAPHCVSFEKKLIDLHCEEKPSPADRLLCKITVPPTEVVCVEYGPRS